ncbi:D-aminoacyl-tRNA deacylase [Haloarcula amylovorans]|uniref:D-aminoacyl-tRNA deacylase n=1 Tax=Haloarcula amylovorans TaxID=2562280 RepID=UPI0010769AD0|nr:D-aminoacyl-tRNA deacylase [Halomicroarcula amylolytica]
MLAVVVSRADEASVHVGEQLRELADWTETTDDSRPDADGGGTVYRTDEVELREFDDWHLELDGVAGAFDDPDLLVFASRHAGETDELLTAHHTGNFGEAEFGGDAGQFARACPNAQREVVSALTEYAPDGYEVGVECTHHGPTSVGVPSMFVEVGSAEAQWRDPDAARAVARAILSLRTAAADAPRENGSRRHLVGFGGGHYAPRFERVIRETDWAVGHIGADWSLDALDEWADDDAEREAVLDGAFDASAADYALLEDDRPDLAATLERLGYRVVEETFVRETTGVPLELVEALEAAVTQVGDGLRFGDPATAAERRTDWTLVEPPADLLSEAAGIDAEALREWVDSNALAFGTEQSGTVVTGPFALPADATFDSLVSALAEILRRRYDSVEREGGELVAREETFDPDLARTTGVPEGPKFGKLSAGHPVEVDGDKIEPDRVQRERIRRFTL